MESVLVSACLLGVNCKYSGGNNLCSGLDALRDRFILIPVCPEQLGGLPTPRPPAECQGQRVISQQGTDVTEQYRRGAEETLKIGWALGCRMAILKSRSPSCGNGTIYDGSFTGTKIAGDGITAKLLKQKGFQVFSEEALSELGGRDFVQIRLTEKTTDDILKQE